MYPLTLELHVLFEGGGGGDRGVIKGQKRKEKMHESLSSHRSYRLLIVIGEANLTGQPLCWLKVLQSQSSQTNNDHCRPVGRSGTLTTRPVLLSTFSTTTPLRAKRKPRQSKQLMHKTIYTFGAIAASIAFFRTPRFTCQRKL